MWAEWHWGTLMLPAGQTAEASEPSTKRNAPTEIVESRTENYFDVFSVEKLVSGTPRMSPALVLLFCDPVSTGRVYSGLLALIDWVVLFNMRMRVGRD
jgi:hypothetical protein